MKTLQQVVDANEYRTRAHWNSAIVVDIGNKRIDPDLWNLSDYRVAASIATGYLLVPKRLPVVEPLVSFM
jgi:hypothetical protein